MSKKDIKQHVREIIEPVIDVLGMKLDDLELKKMKGKTLLRVYIDREDGITIDDCEVVSREIESVLDVEDPIPYSYVLEVSSPGLDRPLRKQDDFRRFLGKTVRVITNVPIEKQTFFVGLLSRADDNEIELLLPKKRSVVILYEYISRARLEVNI